MYHATDPANVNSIQQSGLEVGRESAHTMGGAWADEYYGTRPVYVSVQKGKYEGTPFEIDTAGLAVVADLPSLVDTGAYQEEEGMYWDEGSEPQQMLDIVDEDGMVYFDELLSPGSAAAQAAISVTGTAAVLEDIPPELIQLSELRSYIRALLKEDPMGFVHDLAAASGEFGEEGQDFFGGDPGKKGGKAIKRAFAKNADHNFLSSLDTVHWTGDLYGMEELKGKGKDELSATMTIPSDSFDGILDYGLWIKGRITLAANDQDMLYTGHYSTGAPDEKQIHIDKSSGRNKLPTVSKDYSRYGQLKRGNDFAEKTARNMPYVLDQSTWHKGIAGETNEALVDNWKPVGIILTNGDEINAISGLDYIEGTKEDIHEFAIGVVKRIMLTALAFGVPVYDEGREVLWSPE